MNTEALRLTIKRHKLLYKMALQVFRIWYILRALFYTKEQRYLFFAKRRKYNNLCLQKISQQAIQNVESQLSHILKEKNSSKTPNFYSNALRREVVYTFQYVINQLAAEFNKIDYLEIGSCQGSSLAVISSILRSKGILNGLVSIDPYFESGYIEGDKGIWKESKKVEIDKTAKEIALCLYKHLNFNVELIEDISRLALLSLVKQNRKFQLIYIDGSHEWFNPLIDFGLCTYLIDSGGVIMLDDHHWPDVKYVKELCERHLEKVYECWKIAAYRWQNKD